MRITIRALAVMATLNLMTTNGADAQGLTERLSVHGFLSQAYATSSDLPIHGIPTDGTVDYRSAALQFRYAVSDKDGLIIQVKNRRMGSSMLSSGDDVQLQWAFYQRRIGDASIRVGKVPLSAGLYNEIRDVGTLVPFYRAPASFYMEGVETLNGVTGRYGLDVSGWDIEATASAGAFSVQLPSFDPQTGAAVMLPIEADWVVIGGLMIGTPLDGVRFGAQKQAFKANDLMIPGETQIVDVHTASLDGTFDLFMLRAEARQIAWGDLDILSYYAHGGVKILPGVSLNAQYEHSATELPTPVGTMKQRTAQDVGLGVNYSFSPNIVLKLEGHQNKGYNFDMLVPPTGPRGKSNYFISSISVTF